MSENLNIPTESWRPRRRESGLDPMVKQLGLLAACVLAVLGLGYGGYRMLSHRSHEVPVVEADPRPVRVRPDNPGGMQLVGADELAGASSDETAMAAPPEVPAPQALRAKIDAESQAAAAASANAAASPQPGPAAPATDRVQTDPTPPPVAAAPEQRPAAVAKALARAKPLPPPAATGAVQVQLAAMETEQAATAEWQRLAHRMPDLLGHRQPAVLRFERDGRVFYRLRTGGFADTAAATTFCTQVRAKGGGCSVATF